MSLYVGTEDLEAGLPAIPAAPKSDGVVELVVRRPTVGAREILDEGELTREDGLVGDRWRGASPDTQLTLMDARVADLLAGDRDRWALAGDQLYVDLDLSIGNLPPGTRLEAGTA